MKTTLLIGLRFLLIPWCASIGKAETAPDEIDSFVHGFDGMSLNGLWPAIDLPGTAPIEKVVETFAATQKKTVDAEQYRSYRIVESKKPDKADGALENYTIVLISSDRGSKTILLLRNMDRGWLVRPYFITTVP